MSFNFIPSGMAGEFAALFELIEPIDAAVQRELQKDTKPRPLRDGTIGYPSRRPDDCWTAALATCLCVPIDQVPDPQIDKRIADGEHPDQVGEIAWQMTFGWLAERGLQIAVHHKVPVTLPRWIGIVPIGEWLSHHCMVMEHDRLLYDPGCPWEHETGLLEREDVCVGYSFHPIDNAKES